MNEQPDGARRDTAIPTPVAMAGDGWVNCARGHAHWGRFGAAGLLPVYRSPDGHTSVLLHHRDPSTDQGGTWSLLGGARDSGESAAQAAVREATEESDLDPVLVRVDGVVRDDHGGWSYDTVIASIDQPLVVQPVEGESVALEWVGINDVEQLRLHPGFAASWPTVRARIDAVVAAEPSTGEDTEREMNSALPALPAHPFTGARAIARVEMEHGNGLTGRALVKFDDGAIAVHEVFDDSADAEIRVLQAYVGRAVGARVPLSHLVAQGQIYTDHMPGQPAATRFRHLSDLAGEQRPATRDGVVLGLHYALMATQGVTVNELRLGEQQSLIAVDNGATVRGAQPDAANPLVQTFYRQVEPRVFSWVDNPVPASDIAIMQRQLDTLRPLFAQFGHAGLHDTVMERFGQVAQHAAGTAPLLARAAGEHIALPVSAPEDHHLLPPPVGSPERADQQQACERLLTDDGRILHTGQAKTIAIEALAARMSSPTPALVLASFGLTVGTDMIHHLGDGDYVLVPHIAQYPSMGADVLHVGEVDPADPRHTSEQVLAMDDPRAETLVRQIAVSELMSSWSYGSNNNVRVLALQEATKEEFGLTEVLEWHLDSVTREGVDNELDYNRDTLRDFVRTQYTMTQQIMAERGMTEVLAYRALTWHEGAAQPEWAGLSVGDTFEARQRPLASWATDRQVVADWVEQRGGHAVILVDRKPARDVLAIPMTGIGYLAQKEVVTMPGDSLVTLDGVYTGTPGPAVEQTAASSISLGAPALAGAVAQPDRASTAPNPVADEQWHPLTITDQLSPDDPLDRQFISILSGEQQPPPWWLYDDTGYAITQHDLDQLGVNPVQVKWLLTGESPMGMTPELYQHFGSEMLDALHRDGIDPAQVDIRLKGTGAGFFSGLHKTMPREEDLSHHPTAAARLQQWFAGAENRPLRRPYDAMWRLGLDSQPSDFDLDINSTAIVRAAREYWRTHLPDRYQGDFMGGHGYLNKQAVHGACPALAAWSKNWEQKLGRPLSLGVFELSGPFDATVLGRALSSHFRDTDWVIHRPDNPRAWLNPRSRITESVPSLSPTPSQAAGAAAQAISGQPRRPPKQQSSSAKAPLPAQTQTQTTKPAQEPPAR